MTESPAPAVNTSGGAYIAGNVDTGGGDVIGRDKITHNVTIVIQTPIEAVQAEAQLRQQAIHTSERQPFEPELTTIPGGQFLMGSEPGADIPAVETPQHTVTLAKYAIGKYAVTNAQYAEFVRQTGHPVAPESGWTLAEVGQRPSVEKEQAPVVGVNWDDAVAYCRWLSERTGRAYRLPSEAEWEKAAREAYGCVAMLEGIREWTSTCWGKQRTTPDFGYPYRMDDGRERLEAERGPYREYRVCRGGSPTKQRPVITSANRTCALADSYHAHQGFRVALTQ